MGKGQPGKGQPGKGQPGEGPAGEGPAGEGPAGEPPGGESPPGPPARQEGTAEEPPGGEGLLSPARSAECANPLPPPWPGLPVPGNVPASGCPPGRTGRLTLTVPWRTLAGLSSEPGSICWLGPITPIAAREIAEAGAADPRTEWNVVVTDPAREFICGARIRRQRRSRAGPRHGDPTGLIRPGGPGLINRVTLTVPLGLLETGVPQPCVPQPCVQQPCVQQPCVQQPCVQHPCVPVREQPSSGLAAKLAAALVTAAKANARVGGDSTDRAGSSGVCSHIESEPGYRPSARLRAMIEARDQTCRFPGCKQPAWQTDLDHTIAYDKGGPTCPCNLGPACRTHHQVKQRPGWRLEQPVPGVFRWATPAGRYYVVTPDAYPV